MSKMPYVWDSTRDGQDALFMGQHQRWARYLVYGTAPEMGKMPCLWDSTRDGKDALSMAYEFVSLGVFKTEVIFLEGKQRLSHRKICTQINDY
jgi:hypothetical protein